MKILKCKYILCCDESFKVLENHAIIFDKKIEKILPNDELKSLGILDSAQVFSAPIALPALFNAHTHLEYSANKAHLDFRGFSNWLKSVFENRGGISKALNQKILNKEIKKLLKSGVCGIGEYSSFGLEAKMLAKSPLRSRFYCEILGTNEAFLEQAWSAFLERFKSASALKNERFCPALAIHSPYSTHPNLAKKALEFAKKENLLVSAHLAESKDEIEYLDGKQNGLKESLSLINPAIKPFYSLAEFISMFDSDKTLFIHCVHAKSEFKNLRHIAHCPRSNRFLSSGTLDIKTAAKYANIALGTDGLSSNLSLSIWDEMRAGIMIHKDTHLDTLARTLLLMTTKNAAKALGFDSGEIKVGKNADIACFALPAGSKKSRLALDLILHTKEAKSLFIDGEKIF